MRQTSRATNRSTCLRRISVGTTARTGAGMKWKNVARVRGQLRSSAQREATRKPLSDVSASSSQSSASGDASMRPGASCWMRARMAVESGTASAPTSNTGTCPVGLCARCEAGLSAQPRA
nr:hypothetical protein [Corallococcus exiguus]